MVCDVNMESHYYIGCFFTQVYDILQRIKYSKAHDQVGIGRLLGNRSFNNAFPLHDVSYTVLCVSILCFFDKFC